MTKATIKIMSDPGPIAINVVLEAICELRNVKEVAFLTNGAVRCMDGYNSRGRWDLPSGTITIDLAECVRQLDWVRKGMFVTYNIWYNILYAIYHEAAHAWQCQQEGWTNYLPEDADIDALEKEADEKATLATIEWFERNKLPDLKSMGDLGLEIKQLRNAMYAMEDPHIEDEQRALGTDAAGKAEVVAIVHPLFESEAKNRLFDRIDEGAIGCKINGVRYLKADEILAID